MSWTAVRAVALLAAMLAMSMPGAASHGGSFVTGDGAPAKYTTNDSTDGDVANMWAPVRVATVAALAPNTPAGAGIGKTLTANSNGELVIDDTLLAVNDRVAVMHEAIARDRGIYVVTQPGSPGSAWVLTRAIDADETADFGVAGAVPGPGRWFDVLDGSVNGDKPFVLTTAPPITVDTTGLAFAPMAPKIPYTYTSIVGLSGTTQLAPPNDADAPAVTMPWKFRFYDQCRTKMFVNENGLIRFSDVTPPFVDTRTPQLTLPNPKLPDGYIAPFWLDLEAVTPTANPGIYYGIRGTFPDRQLVVEWKDWDGQDPPPPPAPIPPAPPPPPPPIPPTPLPPIIPLPASPPAVASVPPIDFQVILREGSSEIEVYVKNARKGGTPSTNDRVIWSHTTGIENGSGSRGVRFPALLDGPHLAGADPAGSHDPTAVAMRFTPANTPPDILSDRSQVDPFAADYPLSIQEGQGLPPTPQPLSVGTKVFDPDCDAILRYRYEDMDGLAGNGLTTAFGGKIAFDPGVVNNDLDDDGVLEWEATNANIYYTPPHLQFYGQDYVCLTVDDGVLDNVQNGPPGDLDKKYCSSEDPVTCTSPCRVFRPSPMWINVLPVDDEPSFDPGTTAIVLNENDAPPPFFTLPGWAEERQLGSKGNTPTSTSLRTVLAASTGPADLGEDFENGDALDGVTLATGDRILVKDQGSAAAIDLSVRYTTRGPVALSGLGTQVGGDWTTGLSAGDRILVRSQATPSQNGIYSAGIGGWTRSVDLDTSAELVTGMTVVTGMDGSRFHGTRYMLVSPGPLTINLSPLAFQAGAAQNGVYVVAGSGPPARAIDFDAAADVDPSGIVSVTSGTMNAGTLWRISALLPVTLDASPLPFSAFTMEDGQGQPYYSGAPYGDDANPELLKIDVPGHSMFASTPAVDAVGTGDLTFKVKADFCHTVPADQVSLVATPSDDGPGAAPHVNVGPQKTFTVHVNCINDPPTFDVPAAVSAGSVSGPQKILAFATNILPGPVTAVDEANQKVTFTAPTVGNPALFDASPVIAGNGDLTFTLVPGTCGKSTVTFQAIDDGTPAALSISHNVVFSVVCPTKANPDFFYVKTYPGPSPTGPAHLLKVMLNDDPAGLISLDPVLTGAAPTSGVASVPAVPGDAIEYKANMGAAAGSSDTVTYKIHGPSGTTSTAQAIIRLTDAPMAPVDDTYTGAQGKTLAVDNVYGVLGNDLVGGGDASGPTDPPEHGSVALAADGSFTYTPDAGFYGSDSFRYKLVDPPNPASAEALVIIRVLAVNQPPVAVPDHYLMRPNSNNNIEPDEGVLDNDYDVEHATLSAAVVSSTTFGTLGFDSDGSFTYRPDAGFSGVDRFLYQALDGQSRSQVTEVRLEVQGNVPPVAEFEASGDRIAINTPIGFVDHSYDPDGRIVTWVWTFGDGASSTDRNPMHVYATAGAYDVRLIVKDNDGKDASYTLPLVVGTTYTDEQGGTHAGSFPVADAGKDREVEPGTKVTLDGTGGDGDKAIAFTWEQAEGAPVIIEAGNTAKPSFTAPTDITGPVDLVFSLVIFDGFYLSQPDNVTIRVATKADAATLPRVDAGPDVEVAEGEVVRLEAIPANFGPADLAYAWTQVDGPDAAIAGSAPTLAFQAPPVDKDTVLVLHVRVTGGGATATDTVAITVVPATSVSGFRFERGTGSETGVVAFAPVVQGQSFVWDFDDGTMSTEARPVHAFPESGTYSVKLTVTDAAGGIQEYTQDIRVHVEEPRTEKGKDSPAGIAVAFVALMGALMAAGRRRNNAK